MFLHRTTRDAGAAPGPLQVASRLMLESREWLRSLLERQDGQGMVEYGLILVLIAIVVILVLNVVGRQVKNVFSNVSSALGT